MLVSYQNYTTHHGTSIVGSFYTLLVVAQTEEATALGAAYAAGLAVDFWKSTEELRSLSSTSSDTYKPAITSEGTNHLSVVES
jgi:glycerol kinase